MIRIKPSGTQARMPLTATIVIVILLSAFALNVASVHQVLAEHRRCARLGDEAEDGVDGRDQHPPARKSGPGSSSAQPPRPSSCSARWRCSVTATPACDPRTLHQVKLLAVDILSSMDLGSVVTTDLARTRSPGSTRGEPDPGHGVGLCRAAPTFQLPSFDGLPWSTWPRQVAERHAAVWDRDFALSRKQVVDGGSRRMLMCSKTPRESAPGASCSSATSPSAPDGRAGPLDGTIPQPAATSPQGSIMRSRNPLTALEHPRPAPRKAARRSLLEKPVDDLIGVLKSEIRRLIGVLDSFRDFARASSV